MSRVVYISIFNKSSLIFGQTFGGLETNFLGGNIYFSIAYKSIYINSILIFVSNIWGWKRISGKCVQPKIFHFIPIFLPKFVCVFWGYKNTAETKNSFYPDIRAKHSRGCKHISVMCIKCNFFNSILKFVSKIWVVGPYFWDFLFILIFVTNTSEVETYFWEMCTTLCFSFYPDIRAKQFGGWGLQYISGMCIKPIAKIEWSM